jgi:hypothetical protein
MQCFSFSETWEFRQGYLGPHVFLNEVVRAGWCTESCGWEHKRCRSQQYHITVSFGYFDHQDIRNCYCRFCVERKISRKLPSEHRIRLVFFPQLQNYTTHSPEPESWKNFLWIFFKKNSPHVVMQCFSFSETLEFRQGYLGPHVFINEVVRVGMVHGKLRLGAQKMSTSTIPHNHIIWVYRSPIY